MNTTTTTTTVSLTALRMQLSCAQIILGQMEDKLNIAEAQGKPEQIERAERAYRTALGSAIAIETKILKEMDCRAAALRIA
ncbi:MAG: hypothetical protein FJ271_33120 [Planctomycetes bacterium]|nr:hypothetical protein [Planctomycetota bacterium]